MPRNGSGQFNLPAGNPVVPSTVISSTWANNTLSDIGAALTQSLASDGQTVPSANLPMATFRHTNVGNAAARNDYAAAGQVQDSSLQWLTSVSGTNTITASVTPSPTAYTAGQTFRFTSAGANTGAVTLNINGLGAKAVTKDGVAALSAGEIRSGAVVEVVYDGTQFQCTSISLGRLLNIQKFASNGTYTPTAGTNAIYVEGFGAGGAGGGVTNAGAGNCTAGGGGGAGASGWAYLTSGFTPTVAVTIGVGGIGVANANGNAGTNTTFGALLVLPGGAGGFASGATNVISITAAGGVGGTTPTGTNVTGSAGVKGGFGMAFAASLAASGAGASTSLGAGGASVTAGGTSVTAGANAEGFGSGGSGAVGVNNGATAAGGNGANGLIIVYEYA